MKKISKLKISHLAQKELTENEMGNIKGGNSCCCGCLYQGQGGSSMGMNGTANCLQGIHSPGCPPNFYNASC